MPLKLVPCTAATAEIYVDLYEQAFWPNPINGVLVPDKTPELRSHEVATQRRVLESRSPDRFMFFVVDPDTPSTYPDALPEGEPLAYVRWQVERAGAEEQHDLDARPKPGSNLAARKAFFALIDGMRGDAMAGKGDYLHLYMLMTRPAFERRGAARLALEWGLAKADELGLEVYLDSTPAGKPFYARMGLETVEDGSMDLKQYGVDQVYVSSSMVRRPKGRAPA